MTLRKVNTENVRYFINFNLHKNFSVEAKRENKRKIMPTNLKNKCHYLFNT